MPFSNGTTVVFAPTAGATASIAESNRRPAGQKHDVEDPPSLPFSTASPSG